MGFMSEKVSIDQSAWDAKYDDTTKALKDMGGANAKSQDDLPDGATYKQSHNDYADIEKNKVSNIEFESAEIIQLEKLATDPVSPVAGDMYYNTASSSYKRYTGSAWETVKISVSVV